MKFGNIKNIKQEVLSDNWYTLYKYTYEYQKEDGQWETQQREAYDRGDGVAILLYDPEKGTVVLTSQFRMPTYVNKNRSGMMIEVCAGVLDGDDPVACIKKEVMEETGFQLKEVQKVFEAYMSPGAVTEKLHFFVATYDDSMKVGDGGGAEDETENIEVMEMSFNKAMGMIETGDIKDAKTIMLLQYAAIHQIVQS
ncbi:MAG: NUDIX domain-containing protein [Eudoraea sp.]|nr:NUDIX domain-containing protein [Eudoraea sp.]